MREILFRGKRTDNGEWIEGYLVKLGRESFSYPERYGICNKAIPIGGSGVCYNLKIDEVIPETVGQYTGLTDKNGTKIFEGDVVRYKKNYPCKIEYINCQFAMMWEKNYRDFEDVYDHDVEVIGNIFDNNELLKGGEG